MKTHHYYNITLEIRAPQALDKKQQAELCYHVSLPPLKFKGHTRFCRVTKNTIKAK